MNRLVVLIVLCVALVSGCREPFEPDIKAADLTVLVVEGYLDTEGLPSQLRLSYTRNIQSDDSSQPSYPSAEVYLESASGMDYPLTDLGGGVYEFSYDIPENDNYTLRIIANDGKTYTSELIKPILTPEIIDVGFEKNESGVEVYLTTKGDQNADDFLWTYEETYAYRPRISTSFIYDPAVEDVVTRSFEQRTNMCYRGGVSADLILETSSRFEDQFVFRQSITQIPQNDERLSVRYSILISQKALDKKASEFWEILRKNTNDLGSIFSPLPSNIRGNIKNDQDPTLPVVGFVSLGTVRQERYFIDVREVVPWRADVPEYYECYIESDTVLVEKYGQAFASGSFVPVVPIVLDGAYTPIGYQGAPRRCTDCTLRGTNVKPDFWVD
ncbi:DUF4249 domain-containing protein [Algoriphagus aquimarinus]|uniref:DUF4249 domain-containing protein n=1 Tax=Algoriphagus aquimarinus TaxID=237018 RepID=A0A1I1C0T8_9BACT|nr:DUF4249 domain-containing protein [Algoriphagus aquimarinus]SFB56245.1 protein of unknown function [Algoriphagus aquimarinus]|tara:strand:- start:64026 stop:65180 length:1155 start_codon:yes stop_codon:yes gene_type:complete